MSVVRLPQQAVHDVDARVEVVLDLVEVAVVGVGDLGRDVALGDAVHVLGRDVDGGHEGVDQLVHAAHQFAPAAGELLRVAAGLQLAVLGRLDQVVRLLQQAVHDVDAGIEVVLDLVEVAVVGVGDLGRDVALGDAVHVLGRDVDGGHEGVDQLVHAAHQLAPAAGELLRVAAGLQLAVLGRLDQRRSSPASRPFMTSMQALRLFLISLKSPL